MVDGSAEAFMQKAHRGDTAAQYRLGHRYMNGIGVEKDRVLGHMWLSVAAVGGHRRAAVRREALEGDMIRAEIALGRQRALVCLESRLRDCRPPPLK